MEKEKMFSVLRGVVASSFLNQREKEKLLNFVHEIKNKESERRWIPADNPPEDDKYVLLSFENFSLPLVGGYEEDGEGGAYYVGDCDEEDSCLANDLYVNAWMPLPEPYKEEE